MQILLNLAGFGPLLTSVAISANGVVGWQAWRGGRGEAGLAGEAREARRGRLAGRVGWQAGLG